MAATSGPKRSAARTCTATAHLGISTSPTSGRICSSAISARSGTACTSRRTSRSAPAAVEEFNRSNRWRKRGIAMIPQKYGIAFTEPRGSLNASSALSTSTWPTGRSSSSTAAWRWAGPEHQDCPAGRQHAGHPARVDPRRRQQQRRDRQRSRHRRLHRLRPERRGRGEGLPGSARRGWRISAATMEQFTPHDCIDDWRINWGEKWQEIVFKAWFNRVNLSAAETLQDPALQGP